MIYDLMQDRKHYYIVDIVVPSMGSDKFTPNVMLGGDKLPIEMASPKFFFQYDMLKLANMRYASFNENSHKVTAFEKALRDMRKKLKVKKGDDVSGGDMIISLAFRCDQHIMRWDLLSFENKDHAVMDKQKPDVQINDILSLTSLSEEKIESDKEGEGDIIVFRSPIRRGGAKVDSAPPVPLMRTRSTSTKKRMKTVTSKNTTVTAAKRSPQSEREGFETAAMVVETNVDGDDGALSDDDISISI